MDLATAFLNASMPTNASMPPASLVHFRLIKTNEIWRLDKAVYGLRISPRLWGKTRDVELKAMRFQVAGKMHKVVQSSIDVAFWMIVEDGDEDFAHKRTTCGYVLTYVNDFLIEGS